MGIVAFLLLSLFSGFALGQAAFRKDSIVIGPTGQAIANASVAICTQPASNSTTPCTPLATLYVDSVSPTYSIATIACAADVVTVTTSATNYIPINQWVTISGVTNPSFNGTFQVTSQSSGTGSFSHVQACTNGTSTGGTVAAANPTFSDGLGNYFVYAPAGIYTAQVYSPQITTPMFFQGQGIGIGSSSLGNPNNSMYYVDGLTFSTCAAAVSAASGAGGVVVVPYGYTGAACGTIPSNVSIRGNQGGPFSTGNVNNI